MTLSEKKMLKLTFIASEDFRNFKKAKKHCIEKFKNAFYFNKKEQTFYGFYVLFINFEL